MSPVRLSAASTAMFAAGSRPTTCAGRDVPSCSWTVIWPGRVAAAITWSSVSSQPSGLSTMPDPVAATFPACTRIPTTLGRTFSATSRGDSFAAARRAAGFDAASGDVDRPAPTPIR